MAYYQVHTERRGWQGHIGKLTSASGSLPTTTILGGLVPSAQHRAFPPTTAKGGQARFRVYPDRVGRILAPSDATGA